MVSNFSVTITLTASTQSSLKNAGYSLYGFKAVKTSLQGGVPLVWFSTKNYLTSTQVNWEESYQAYISTTSIAPNTRIIASNSANIDLGQTMNVDTSGNVDVVQGGVEGAVSVVNNSNQPYSTGISQKQAGVFNPICAFPLFGNMLDVMMPIEKVLFMFATNQVETGTVIYRAYSQGILIDLTGVDSRAVAFDLNTGWSAAGAWGRTVAPSSDMLPILIESNN